MQQCVFLENNIKSLFYNTLTYCVFANTSKFAQQYEGT